MCMRERKRGRQGERVEDGRGDRVRERYIGMFEYIYIYSTFIPQAKSSIE